jgi:hypothetical protein
MEELSGVERLSAILVYLLVGLFNAAGHWFPWRMWDGLTNERGQLQRVLAYVYGAGSIVGGVILRCVFWLLMEITLVSVEQVIFVLIVTVVSAAAGTMIPYAIDEWIEHRDLIQDVEDYEQTLER